MGNPAVSSSDLLFFLDRGCNLLGKPLSNDVRVRLAQAVDWPCLATWEAAYGCILNDGGMTLWIALLSIQAGAKTQIVGDYHAGQGRWVNLPSAREVAAAVRFATS